jgi:signal transduction histidine kinase
LKRRFSIFLLLLFRLMYVSEAQQIARYNTFSYNVNEGLLQSTFADIAFDKNNFCWISFPNGVQKFDGKNFITVPVQPGFPDDKLVYFFQCQNGDLLISHSQGISKYEITGNRFTQVYNNILPGKKPVQFVGEDENIIYFYNEASTITGIDGSTFKVVTETKTGLPNYSSNTDYRPTLSDNIINHKAAFQIKSLLYLWDLKKEKLLYNSSAIEGISNFFLRLKNETEVLFYTYKINNALQLYNFTTTAITVLPVAGKNNDKHISRCIIHPWQNKTLLSFSDKLYEADAALQTLKSELVNFQNQPIAGNSGIAQIKEDNFGNLFLHTITDGVKKIIRNNYPIRYYGTEKKEDNFVMSILPDKKNNRILAGTSGNGLLVFDTLQHLVKHIKTLPGKNTPFVLNTIIKNNKGDYLLFINSEESVWQLSYDLAQFHQIKISTSLPKGKSGIQFFSTPLFQNEMQAIVLSQSMLYKTNFAAKTTTEHQVTTSYTMSGLLYNNTIITHANDELIFLDTETLKELKRIPFRNTGNVRCFAKDAANNIYAGSNNGIYKIDSTGKILLHLKKENGLPDDCIYAMVFDDEGSLWCSTNRGILKINKDNSILQLKKEDGLQENEFNTNVVAKAEDGELFFGGVNGVSSFYPAGIGSFDEKINLLFTSIQSNNEDVIKDTAAWNITSISLPYTRNSLSFDFLAMGNSNPDHYIYQYMMEGVDKKWIQNDGMQRVRYSLPPGTYIFKIYASRFFDKDAQPMKELRIIIHPPFWKTWWFLTGLGFLFIGLLAFAINRNAKNKYEKKLQVLESERKLKQERERISRDLHDSLGAYANAVLYNIELLEKEKGEEKRRELIGDLKFASKDIITSLRETVWALKKEKYTAEECLVRIRNFIQPLARYYSHIHFQVEGESYPIMELPYTKALNVVRIVQEAVSNSIKHANPKNIIISSLVADNRWSLAVSDDGKGFNYFTAKQLEQGNGLNNMHQRAAESGFEFIIKSRETEGTTMTIII